MNKISILLLALLFWSISLCSYSQANYIGSQSCAQCHQTQLDSWQQSQHWHSMEVASSTSVLGDFNNVSFEYFDLNSTFYQRDGQYYVETDNSNGQLQEFEIKYTFGIYPLQQYLIEFSDGRLQVLSISWDSRAENDGGQRWYHLYPDEQILSDNPLHWTGAFQNWNSRCASCHSTNLEKNYNQQNNSYETHWSEINVACESCHGQGSEHVQWANIESNAENNDRTNAIANKGLLNSLKPIWSPTVIRTETGDEIDTDNIESYLQNASNQGDSHSSLQKDVCASCHARRSELSLRNADSAFLDQHNLSMLNEGLYYPDGQILDEVYVYGSFLQSKMHQNQVSCSNCHDPHSQQLKIEGNGLCLQCHLEEQFDTQSHYFHEQGSTGAQCVNCHMPSAIYMGVDSRRDHSFRIPDPFISLISDAPNACTQCHEDKDDAWAAETLTSIKGRTEPYYRHANIFQRARDNDAYVLPELLALIADESLPVIIRATAVLESERFPTQENATAAIQQLQSDEALIRSNAVRSLSYLPLANRYQALQVLISDPVKSVRMEVASQLAEIPLQQLPQSNANELNLLFDEYIEAENFNADMPEVMTDLALFYIAREDYENAESSFKHALQLSFGYLPALLNLADLYRMLQREDEGETLLLEAIASYPESANAHHALGLLYVRAQRVEESLALLAEAVNLAPDNARFVLIYTLALEQLGQLPTAITVLREAVTRFPTDSQLYQLLQDYSARR